MIPRSRRRPRIEAIGTTPRTILTPEQQMRMQHVLNREPTTDAHDQPGETPCRCCGATVASGGAAYFGPWRHHAGCVRSSVDPAYRLVQAARWLQVASLTHVEATLVEHRVPLFAEVEVEPTSKPRKRPWSHVDKRALSRALDALPDLRIEAGLDAAPCTLGRCALCGIEEARNWQTFGHHWADGSEAALCGDCSAIYVRQCSPSPEFWEDHREVIAAAITGVALPMGYTAPTGLLAYAESPDSGGSPWSHLRPDAVDSYRWSVWTRWPLQAPMEVREEAVRRAAQWEVQRAAQRAQKAADEAARLDVHGFGEGA